MKLLIGRAMRVEIKGIDSFMRSIDTWVGRVEKGVAEAAMGLAHEAFDQILENAPQNSGDFVANTKVSKGAINPSFTPFALNAKVNQYSQGSSPAQAYAKSRASWAPGKLGEAVFIHSTAQHDEPYSWKIESGQIKLRPVNAGASHIYERAYRHTQHKYRNIYKNEMTALMKAGR